MPSIYESIRDNWSSSGIHVNDGASPDAISRFQDKHRIIIPNEFIKYLFISNGILNNETDSYLISFLPIELIDTKIVVSDGTSNVVDIVFAEYLVRSHVYALRSTTEGTQLGVYALDGEHEKEIAATFEDFLRAYHLNPECIANCW